jgi:hypothetical protein
VKRLTDENISISSLTDPNKHHTWLETLGIHIAGSVVTLISYYIWTMYEHSKFFTHISLLIFIIQFFIE